MIDFTVVKGEQLMGDFFSQSVTDKLAEMNLSYDSLVETKYSDTGEIQSVNTNVINVNMLKNAVALDISNQLSEYYEFSVDFPLSNALGSEFFSGMGPTFNFNSYVTGNVKTDFRSEFESGGINQTIHRLYIDITGDLIVLAGGEQEPIQLTTSVLVGETIIVADVPGLYTGNLLTN